MIVSPTDRLLSISDRTILALSYDDMIAQLSGYHAQSDGYVLHGQVFKKSNLHPIIEMIPHHLVYYSYERKYHKLSSMFVPGYQCLNIYINDEKRASMNKNIQ